MSEKNELLPQAGPPKDPALIVKDDSEFSNLLDTAKFNHMWRVATVFSQTQMVPEHFQGSPANCFVACQMAVRLQVDPMMFMQKSYIVYGRPGIESQLKIGLVNKRGPFSGPIQWKFDGEGPTRACTAYATLRSTGEVCEYRLTWDTVVQEGWTGKSGSKWKTMPDKMFRYRSASWLIDLYCPEVVLGLATIDELLDHEESKIFDVTPTKSLPEPPREPNWQGLEVVLPENVPLGLMKQFLTETARVLKADLADVVDNAIPRRGEVLAEFEKWYFRMYPPVDHGPSGPVAEPVADDSLLNKPDPVWPASKWTPTDEHAKAIKDAGFDPKKSTPKIIDYMTGAEGLKLESDIDQSMDMLIGSNTLVAMLNEAGAPRRK